MRFGQQNPVRHQLDRRLWLHAVAKAHFVAHDLTQVRIQLLRNALRDRGGRYAPRLGVADEFSFLPLALGCAPQVQGNFWQLGGFARAGLAAHNDDLVRLQGRFNLSAACAYG